MGEKVVAGAVDLSDRQAYRSKLNQCLEGLGRLLAERRFDRPRNLMGLEIELNLAGSDGMPRMMNQEVLQRIASRDFQTELGMFNLEVNIVPHRLGGRVFDQLSEELRTGLAYAHRKAGEVDAGIVMIGILPTLGEHDVVSANLSDVDRYTLLNDQMAAARGEDFALDIEGVEHLVCSSPSIAPESACTSVQLHLQVTPARFADVWNAAQAIASVQIALGANAPFLFGKELWRESRPPLFQQATDVRPPELANQGVRPRTWFGERWITSAYELFEENLRYFPPLLPICDEEEPLQVLDEGGVPELAELVLHNGTVYRWNRPVYGMADGVPHLRVENTSTAWTNGFEAGAEIIVPLKNGEGGFIASDEELKRLEGEGQVAFRYLGVNPNGSMNDIAGISNARGNVVGLMPHPEHATEEGFGPDTAAAMRSGVDGLTFFTSVIQQALAAV